MIRWKINGNEMSEAEFRAAKPRHEGLKGILKSGNANCLAPSRWPVHSDAAGCGVNEIEKHYQDSIKRGVPTRFDNEGRAVFESRQHRKRYCKAYGLIDKNGTYGDAT